MTTSTGLGQLNTHQASHNAGAASNSGHTATKLEEALQNDPTITKIDLRGNALGPEGVVALSKALKTNQYISSLDLRMTNLGPEEGELLAYALKSNSSVTHFNLSNNRLGKKGVKAIAQALRRNTTVTEVLLNNNQVGLDAKTLVSQTLGNTFSPTTLDLLAEYIEPEGEELVRKLLDFKNALKIPTELRKELSELDRLNRREKVLEKIRQLKYGAEYPLFFAVCADCRNTVTFLCMKKWVSIDMAPFGLTVFDIAKNLALNRMGLLLHELDRFQKEMSHREERFQELIRRERGVRRQHRSYVEELRALRETINAVTFEDPILTAYFDIQEKLREMRFNLIPQINNLIEKIQPPQYLVTQTEASLLVSGRATKPKQINAIIEELDGFLQNSQYALLHPSLSIIRSTFLDFLTQVQESNEEERRWLLAPKPTLFLYDKTPQSRFLKPQIEKLFFSSKGSERSENIGTHLVYAYRGAHWKVEPHAPGIEHLVASLNNLIAGMVVPPTKLVKVQRGKEVLTCIVSKSVVGENLDFLLRKHPDLINKIDPYSFSVMCALGLLIDPHDGKPDNYMAQLNLDSLGEIIGLRLLGIDNDLSFANPIALHRSRDTGGGGEKHFPEVKNVLYFLPQMKNPIDSEFRDNFLSLTPEIIVLDWLESVYRKNKEYEQLFKHGIFSQERLKKLKLPIFLVAGIAKRLQKKLLAMQGAMKENPDVTHEELFKATEPILSKYYRNLQREYPDPMDAIFELYALSVQSVEERLDLRTQITTQHKAMTALALRTMELGDYEKKRSTPILQELEFFISEMEWDKNVENQQEILNKISRMQFIENLSFFFCSGMDRSFLEGLVNFKNLESLTLVGCDNVEAEDLVRLSQSHPNLKLVLENNERVRMSDWERLVGKTRVTPGKSFPTKAYFSKQKLFDEALKALPSITSLDLSESEVGPEETQILAQALMRNTSIVYLDLSDNELGSEGAKAIAEALKINSSIAELNISSNNLGPEGRKAMIDALKFNSTLVDLQMDGNGLISYEEELIITIRLLRQEGEAVKSLRKDLAPLDDVSKTEQVLEGLEKFEGRLKDILRTPLFMAVAANCANTVSFLVTEQGASLKETSAGLSVFDIAEIFSLGRVKVCLHELVEYEKQMQENEDNFQKFVQEQSVLEDQRERHHVEEERALRANLRSATFEDSFASACLDLKEQLFASRDINLMYALSPLVKQIKHPRELLAPPARRLGRVKPNSEFRRIEKLMSELDGFIKQAKLSSLHAHLTTIRDTYADFVTKMKPANEEERQKLCESKATFHLVAENPEYRFLTNETEALLFSEQKAKDGQKYGHHEVFAYRGVHWKIAPTAPGVEYMVGSLNNLIAGTGSPPTGLVKVQRGDEVKICIVSKTVVGQNLDFLLRGHPDLIDKIEPFNFSAMCTLGLLTDPYDAKPDNYMAQLNIGSKGEVIDLKLIGIDNDLAFANPIVLEKRQRTNNLEEKAVEAEHFVEVKNVLYFFPQMENVIDRDFRKRFLTLTPEVVVLDWLESIHKKNEEYEKLVNQEIFSREELEELKLPIQLDRGTALTISNKLRVMQMAMRENEELTHEELFFATEPILQKYYRNVQREYPNPLKAIGELYAKNTLSVEERVNLKTKISSRQKLQSAIALRVKKMRDFEKRSSPIPQEIQRFISEIDWNMGEVEQGKVLSKISRLHFLEELNFTNCSTMGRSFFEPLGDFKKINSLTLTRCAGVRAGDLVPLSKSHPNLKLTLIGNKPLGKKEADLLGSNFKNFKSGI